LDTPRADIARAAFVGKARLTGCNVIMQILISQSGGLPNTLTKKLAVYLSVRARMSTRRKRLPTMFVPYFDVAPKYLADAVNCVPHSHHHHSKPDVH
jgi:hypothetical protein